IQTPFRWSYVAISAALVPASIKTRVQPDCREKEDYYPVLYRCNTPTKMRKTCRHAGLEEIRTHLYASDGIMHILSTWALGRLLIRLELYLIRLSLKPRWRWLRVTMCAIYQK